ncbi:TetR family transcriptional regulator C-terminal domain-containing protein [Amycolatopsis carbonis]|uniref:TetR family transcriptional regulator C-terminal domain-containing protein n=1 Tax=Amycolatopsis carbonis TaxID=715471 RepID=A0A9Y2N251_9PSEU|nr:TetR family transcriptional regulator C-terminal domain-containing protein [Amycolatopsis sp. 2-15]WIX83664.1 TetR family transcriptional regulator C-terminal domain-containing protein [Amycolatopsis sp. 2-15]
MTADWYDRPRPSRDNSEPGPRARVVAAATTLLLREGVGSLTAARVHAAARVTQAELNQLFPDSGRIVEAIVEAQLEVVLRAQRPSLNAVERLTDLEQWQSRLLDSCAAQGGCPLGSLIYHLAHRHDRGRLALATAFSRWQGLLASALSRIQAAGELDSDVAPEVLAVGVIAALQGGYLLAHTTQDADQLRASLDMALGQVRFHST